jgi:hypothetical protein
MKTSDDCNSEILTVLILSKATFNARTSFPEFLNTVYSGAAFFVAKNQTGRSTVSRRISGIKIPEARRGGDSIEMLIGCYP